MDDDAPTVPPRPAIPTVFVGAPRVAELVVVVGADVGRSRAIDGPVLIGRDASAQLIVLDEGVSRRHARIVADGEQFVLEDLGSRNGTRVGATVLRGGERALHGGDAIRIGGHEVVVAHVGGGAPAAPAGDDVVVADPNMSRIFALARRAARTSTTVLLVGETGVGKEIVARQIHASSARAAGPCVRVNCAALPEALAESELFGHEKGAFTGADRRKAGLVEAASGGTLFLDEIGELAPPVQAKLLVALESRAIVRLGSTVETPVDVRVVCATHRDLPAEVAAGRFRQDLYYRIGALVIRIPPLRERPGEILLLAQLFARRLREEGGDPTLDPSAAAALLAHPWPGNVRELRNALEHALLHAEGGVVRAEHLPESVRAGASRPAERKPRPGGVKAALAEVERASIEEALRATGGNRTRAAQQLGISLRSLLYKIDKYGLGPR
jgi:transcriptional regulator with PAS, ATPase and Fis domain